MIVKQSDLKRFIKRTVKAIKENTHEWGEDYLLVMAHELFEDEQEFWNQVKDGE